METNLIKQLFEEFKELGELTGNEREKLLSIINSCKEGKFQHKLFPKERYYGIDNNKILRKINFRNWKTIISPFFEIAVECADRTSHITDAWKFTERMNTFLNNYSERINTEPELIENINREILINIKLSGYLLTFILDCIRNDNIILFNKVMHPKHRIETVAQLLMKRDVVTSLLDNAITNQYKETEKSKRLFMVSPANLQMADGEIRDVFLSGLGNFNYDIVNCHFTLIWQLLNDISYEENDHQYIENEFHKQVEFPELYKLVKDPDNCKKYLANEWCVDVPKAKQILTSLVNGGAQNFSSSCFKNFSLIPEQERTHQDIIFKTPEYNRLKNEFKKVSDMLYKKYGNTLPKISKKIFISYLVGTEERKILDVICNKYQDAVQLKVHDGWVLNFNEEVSKLETLINEKAGYQVKVKKNGMYENTELRMFCEI